MTFAICFAAAKRLAVRRGDRDGATRFGGAADTGAILTNYHVFRHFRRGTVRRDNRRGGAFVFRDIGGGSDKRLAISLRRIQRNDKLSVAVSDGAAKYGVVTVTDSDRCPGFRLTAYGQTIGRHDKTVRCRRLVLSGAFSVSTGPLFAALSVTLMLNVSPLIFAGLIPIEKVPSSPAVPLPSVFPGCL